VTEYGDSPEEGRGLLQDNMTFSLEYEQARRKKDDDPMWASSSPAPGEWFFAEEGS